MIEVYGTEICSYCNAAKNLLESRGVFYKYYLIGSDISREEVLTKFPDKRTVPIIIVDGRVLDDGFTSLKKEIDEIVENTKGGFGDQAI